MAVLFRYALLYLSGLCVSVTTHGQGIFNIVPGLDKPGLNHFIPLTAIDTIEFATQYHGNKKFWDEAFDYIKNTDFSIVPPGKYSVDEDNVMATVYEGPAKLKDTTKWEAHMNYEDIHYVYRGEEQIGIAPLMKAKQKQAYNERRDITFYDVSGTYITIRHGTFMIVFTHQVHRPGIRITGADSVKHVVVKVKKVF